MFLSSVVLTLSCVCLLPLGPRAMFVLVEINACSLPLVVAAAISRLCQTQIPDVSISAPDIGGSLPEVAADVSVPSVGGVDVNVAAPSVDVEASIPSASIDPPGGCKSPFFFVSCLSTWSI